jgi:hypothetical protein
MPMNPTTIAEPPSMNDDRKSANRPTNAGLPDPGCNDGSAHAAAPQPIAGERDVQTFMDGDGI